MKSLLKSALIIAFETVCRAVFALPRFHFLGFFKALLLRLAGARIGKRVTFYPGVWVMTGRNLVVGDDVDLALDVLITTDGGVTIGNRVLIGYRTMILSRNHTIPKDRGPIFAAGHSSKPVHIDDDSWIGGNCIILPGVTIGKGCVIGAGSVVTKSIPDYTIAVGNPARPIRTRD